MSIRLRLTVWYTLVLATVLAVVGLFLYWLMAQNLLGSVNRTLRTRADDVWNSIRVVEPAPLRLHQILLPDFDVFSSPGIYYEVVDASGRVVARSTSLGDQSLPLGNETLQRAARGERFFQIASAAGEPLRLYHRPLQVEGQTVGLLLSANRCARSGTRSPGCGGRWSSPDCSP